MRPIWKLLSLGDGKYDLLTPSGSTVGWIHGHTVGLTGLRNYEEALTAASGLRRALDEALQRAYPDRFRPLQSLNGLRLVHDGAYEWLAAGSAPVARLHRPRTTMAPNDSFAIEFVLPSYASEPVTVAVASMLANRLYDQVLASLFAPDIGKSTSAKAYKRSPARKGKARDAGF